MKTPWGRILIGVLLAQGLFYALRHLIDGVGVARGGLPDWPPMTRFLFWQGLQIAALLPAMALTGSGQVQAALLGMLGGAISGVLVVLLQAAPAPELGNVGLYGPPVLHTLAGAIGAWFGSVIWRPVAPPVLPGAVVRKGPAPRRRKLFSGPIAWFRVAVGSALAVAGCLCASAVFDFVMELGHGKLSTDSYFADQIVTWEIRALAMLLAAALAGATTPNGLKQGLAVGVLTSGILLAFPRYHATPQVIAWTLFAAFSLSLAGGWFGGQILPPVIQPHRARIAGPV
jgi:hypothetical protein